jgi:hypothetical protein
VDDTQRFEAAIMTGDHIDRQMELTIERWPLGLLIP